MSRGVQILDNVLDRIQREAMRLTEQATSCSKRYERAMQHYFQTTRLDEQCAADVGIPFNGQTLDTLVAPLADAERWFKAMPELSCSVFRGYAARHGKYASVAENTSLFNKEQGMWIAGILMQYCGDMIGLKEPVQKIDARIRENISKLKNLTMVETIYDCPSDMVVVFVDYPELDHLVVAGADLVTGDRSKPETGSIPRSFRELYWEQLAEDGKTQDVSVYFVQNLSRHVTGSDAMRDALAGLQREHGQIQVVELQKMLPSVLYPGSTYKDGKVLPRYSSGSGQQDAPDILVQEAIEIQDLSADPNAAEARRRIDIMMRSTEQAVYSWRNLARSDLKE